jgi:acetyltransferase-like isoleucine patch superfamily enzyme
VAAKDVQNIKSMPVVLVENDFMEISTVIFKGLRVGACSIIGVRIVVDRLDTPSDRIIKGNPAAIVNVRHGRE